MKTPPQEPNPRCPHCQHPAIWQSGQWSCPECLHEMKDESHDGCSFSCDTPDPRPWWKRKLAQLWPMNHEPLPDLPEWATDGIVVQLKTEFSFLDRLRILLSGRVKYRVLVACEFPPGQTSAQTQTETRPPEILHPGTF